jgi:hypothetical protein
LERLAAHAVERLEAALQALHLVGLQVAERVGAEGHRLRELQVEHRRGARTWINVYGHGHMLNSRIRPHNNRRGGGRRRAALRRLADHALRTS